MTGRKIRRTVALLLTLSLLIRPNPVSIAAGAESATKTHTSNVSIYDEILHLVNPVSSTYAGSFKERNPLKRRGGNGYPWEKDTEWWKEWYLDDIAAENAWITVEGRGRHPGQDIVVAVVDTGVDVTHPDLIDNLWVNEPEKNGYVGVDDDGNGYVDDIYGGNVVQPGEAMTDVNGHGTQMAGIIAMTAGNGGGVGVAYGVKIMPVKVSNKDEFSVASALAGFAYAIKNGADIVSMSFSSEIESEELKQGVVELSRTCIPVSAAGNEGHVMPDITTYPAGYDCVTGVMAYGMSGRISSFSNWDSDPGRGAEFDIAAPGEDIYSTAPNGLYTASSGTSQATAMVSGAMAVALGELRAAGYHPTPSAFKAYFLNNMHGSTNPDSSHGNIVYRRLSLSDVINYATAPLDTSTPTPTATPTPKPTATPATTSTGIPTVPPLATLTPTPLPTETPAATVEPTVTPTPGPTVVPGDDPALKTGTIERAGKNGERAYYRIKSIAGKTVTYYRCYVKSSRKKAQIPSHVQLSDGKFYRIVGIRKKCFVNRKKVKKVTVYATAITKKMMKKAIRGSNVKKVVYDNKW